MSWLTRFFGGKSLTPDDITSKRGQLTVLRDEYLSLLNKINTHGVTSELGKALTTARDTMEKSIKSIEKELIDAKADTSSLPRAATSITVSESVRDDPLQMAVATLPPAPAQPAAPAAVPPAAAAAPPAAAAAPSAETTPPAAAASAAADADVPTVSAAKQGRKSKPMSMAQRRLKRIGLVSSDEEEEENDAPVANTSEAIEVDEVPRRFKRLIRPDPEAEAPEEPTPVPEQGATAESSEEEKEDEEEEEDMDVEAGDGADQGLFNDPEQEDGADEPMTEELVNPLDSTLSGVRVGKAAAPAKKVEPGRFTVVLWPKKPYEYPGSMQAVIKAAQELVAQSSGKRRAWRPKETNAYEVTLGVRLKGEKWKHLSFLHTGSGTWRQFTTVPGKQNAWREFRRSVCPLLRDQKHVVDTDNVELVVFGDWWDYHVNRFSMGMPDVVDTQERPDDYYNVITRWDARAAKHAGEEYTHMTDEQLADIDLVMRQCMSLVNRRMRDIGDGKDTVTGHATRLPRAGCRAVNALYLLLAYTFALPNGFTPDRLLGQTHFDLFWELVHPNSPPIKFDENRSVPMYELFHLLADETYEANEDDDEEVANAVSQRTMKAFVREVVNPRQPSQPKASPARKPPPKRAPADDDDELTPEERMLLERLKKRTKGGTKGKNKRPDGESGPATKRRLRPDTTAAVQSGRVEIDPSRRVNWYDRLHPVTARIPLSEAEQKQLDAEIAALEDDEDAEKFGASWMEGYTLKELGLDEERYRALPRRQSVFKLVPAARHAVYNADPEELRLFLENCKALIYQFHFVDNKEREGKHANPPRVSVNVTRDTTYERSERAWLSVSVPDTRMRPLGARSADATRESNPIVHRKQWDDFQYDSTIRTLEFQEMLRILEASDQVFPLVWNAVHAQLEKEPDFKSGNDDSRDATVMKVVTNVFLAPLEDRLGGFWTLNRAETISRAGENLFERVLRLATTLNVENKEEVRKLSSGIKYPYAPCAADGKGYVDRLRRIISERAVALNERFAVHDPEDCARLRPARALRPPDEAEFVKTVREEFARQIRGDYNSDWVMPTVKSMPLVEAPSKLARTIVASAATADVSKFSDFNDLDGAETVTDDERRGEEVEDEEAFVEEEEEEAAYEEEEEVEEEEEAPMEVEEKKQTKPPAAVSKPKPKAPVDDAMDVEPRPKPTRTPDAAPGPDMRVTSGMSLDAAHERMREWARMGNNSFPPTMFDPATAVQVMRRDKFAGNLKDYATKLRSS